MIVPPSSLRANLLALPRPAWILFAGTFINRFGTFVVPFLILYLTSAGYSVAQAGMAVGAYGIGHLLAAGLGGYLADRIGRRETIVVSMFSSAAAMMALSQARELWLIVVFTGLAGLTAELYRPASSALLADLTAAGDRVTAFAMYRLAINTGIAAGPAVAGFLAGHSFFYIFAGDAVTSIAYGLVAFFALPRGSRSSSQDSAAGSAADGGMRGVLSDRRFLYFLLASIAISFVYMQSTSTFALHVTAGGLSTAAYGMLISLNGLIVVLCELPITSITRRFPVPRVIATGFALVGLGYLFTGAAHTMITLALTVVVWTFGEIVSAPVASAYVADLAPAHLRGRYMGIWGFTWSSGLTFGPTVGTLLFVASPTALWVVCGALGLLAAGLVMLEPR